MLTNIIPSLERVEHVQFHTLMEQIIPAVSMGTMREDLARSILRTNLNELVYNIKIARGVNFRYEDQSGIFNYKEPMVYMERLLRPEGDNVVEELRAGETYFCFETHDMSVNLSTLDAMEIDYRMLSMFRHPVDNIYSWWKRGWGERFGVDPRAFTLTLSHNGQKLAWHDHEHADQWLQANPAERCALSVLSLLSRSIEQHTRAAQKDRIHIYTFENFAVHPDKELNRICKFLHTDRTEITGDFIKKARCPRVFDSAERKKKITEMTPFLSETTRAVLSDCSRRYEQNLYGLNVWPEVLAVK